MGRIHVIIKIKTRIRTDENIFVCFGVCVCGYKYALVVVNERWLGGKQTRSKIR